MTQYFSFFVQFGVEGREVSLVVLLMWEAFRDMEITRSAFGLRPWEGPRLWPRGLLVFEGAREGFGASRLKEVDSSIMEV